jgi:uncharacterized damage-inducible protein DinB
MSISILARIFEHNNWANRQIIEACKALSAEQSSAEPVSATRGSIQETLIHLVGAQAHYLKQLTGQMPKYAWENPPPLDELADSAEISGAGLLALANDLDQIDWNQPYRANDGWIIDRWVIMLQAINHATEHREQIKSMLTALGLTPPSIDGWDYGEAADAAHPPEK